MLFPSQEKLSRAAASRRPPSAAAMLAGSAAHGPARPNFPRDLSSRGNDARLRFAPTLDSMSPDPAIAQELRLIETRSQAVGRESVEDDDGSAVIILVLSLLLALSLERSVSTTQCTGNADPAGQLGSGGCSSTSVVAQGTASKRSNGIGFPDTSLTPYVPSSMRRSARSIFSSVSRSSSLSAITGSRSVTIFASSPSSRISSSRGSVSSSSLLRAASRD